MTTTTTTTPISPSSMPQVSVIIPTYNGLELLKKHLPAVLSNLHHNDEVVLIDDAGTDETEAWFLESFRAYNKEGVTVGFYSSGAVNVRMVYLKNQENVRFALSVNRAVEQAQHNLLWLLNNDVEPHLGCLDQLIWCFTSQPDMFAVGCKELEPPDLVGGKNQLFFKQGLFQHQRADEFSTGPTAWVSGGSGLFDKEKWLLLRGFDPVFAPAYWEDIDLSRRAQQAGWQTWFCEKAVVDHNHETTNQSVFGQVQLLKASWHNADIFTQKHAVGLQTWWFWFWHPIWQWRRRRILQAHQGAPVVQSRQSGIK